MARYTVCGPRLIAAALIGLITLSGCRTSSDRDKTSNNIPKGARVLHFDYAGGRNVRTLAFNAGIACQADGVLGPWTFSATDVGKSGVPRLTQSEATVLARIRRYVSSPTLRFTWVGSEFVVYDAISGVCNGGQYAVMNGDCNEIFSPTDTQFDHTFAGTGCRGTPPPWDAGASPLPR
jgi:hypothetical protein